MFSRPDERSRGAVRCLVADDDARDVDWEPGRVDVVRDDDEREDDARCPVVERCDEELRDELVERDGLPCDRVPRRDSWLMVLQLLLSSIVRIHRVDFLLQQQRRHQLCQP